MWPVCIKEFRQFFSSLTGYIAIVVFLLLNGLFLFVFPDTNILDFGYATLDKFFELSPWILLLLIPAITMRSFADEFKGGTFEILQTKPLSRWQIVGGKYFGALLVVLIALLPTFIYAFTILQLSELRSESTWTAKIWYIIGFIWRLGVFVVVYICSRRFIKGHKFISLLIGLIALLPTLIYMSNILGEIVSIDMGAIIGSYIGLIFLAGVFVAIGVCCSSFTNNAVVAFIVSAFVCFILYSGFNAISRIPALEAGADYYVEMAGIDFHYRSVSRGVVDSRDIIYFLCVIGFFLVFTGRNLLKR